MMIGNLIKFRAGDYGTIVQGPYTFRFIDTPVDRDMIDNGMGHLAGSYGSAVDIINHKTGSRTRHNISDNSFEVINESR